jgi:hypothetical protein
MNMNTLPLASRRFPGSTGQFVVHVAGEPLPIRAVTIWPIAEILGADDQLDALRCDGTLPADVETVSDTAVLADLLESLLIAPPRPRHRRERLVSSRAAFFQS